MMESASQWHSYYAYLGDHYSRADAVLQLLARAFAGRIPRWFYLRYADTSGPHIRVRVHRSQCDATWLEDELEAVVADAPYQPRSTSTPLVTLPAYEMREHSFFGVRREEYVPELDVYHGHEGVAIAEDHFVDSTRIAIRIMQSEAEAAATFSRKSILTRLMVEALGASLPQQQWIPFCEMYGAYWLNHTKSQPLAAGFQQKARSLAAAEVPLVARDVELPPAVQESLREWTTSITTTMRRYEQCVVTFGSAERTRFLSGALHLLNNRLDVRVHEEAYVATLLRHHLELTGSALDGRQYAAG